MAATLPQSRKTNLMMGLRLKVCYTFRLHCRHWSSWQGFDLLMGSSLAGAEVSKCTRRTAEWGRQRERERETTVVIKVAVSAATAADLRHSLALSSACLSACLSVCLSLSPFVDIIHLLRNSLSLVQVHFHNELTMPIARPGKNSAAALYY